MNTAHAQPATPRYGNLVLRWVAIVGGGLLVFAFIYLFVSPPGRRLLAQPTSAQPVVNVNQIAVRGDVAQNHLFDPPVVQVPVGTTITWNFVDYGPNGGEAPVPHDVVFSSVRSPIFETGSFSHTFTEPGTYTYFCSLHAFMEGRIEVVAQ
jgi:plastocyanin